MSQPPQQTSAPKEQVPAQEFLPPTIAEIGHRPVLAQTVHLSLLMRYSALSHAADVRRSKLERSVTIAYNERLVSKDKENYEKSHPQGPAYDADRQTRVLPLAKSFTAVPDLSRQAFIQRFNSGFDDKDGHYVMVPGEEIMNRFVLHSILGKGSFGTVVKATDLKTQEPVAIKISRSGSYFINQAKLEVEILLRVNGNPRLSSLAVRLRKYVMWQQHAVLVFQLLSLNLYQLIKLSRFNGVSLDLTRKFACQLLQVLTELERSNPPIIHCDLKPENLLLYDQSRSGIRVIDFGSACFDSPLQHKHKYIQSRFYRSPEVILGLPYSTAIDRWSLGCILVEMHTGSPLFPGKSEAEQLGRMEAALGPIPPYMIVASPKKDQFYQQMGTPQPSPGSLSPSSTNAKAWPTSPVIDPSAGTAGSSGRAGAAYKLIKRPEAHVPSSLDNFLGTYSGGPGGRRAGQPGHGEAQYKVFVDFISKLLAYDPQQRLSCTEAMQHPFLAPLTSVLSAPPPASASGTPTPAGGTASSAATGNAAANQASPSASTSAASPS